MVEKKTPRCKISVNPGWLKSDSVWQSGCFMPVTSDHLCCCQLKNKNYNKGPKKNRKICLKKELCSATMAAHVLASVNLVAVVLFPGPSPCSKMIRFTGMSKWVILFIHCSCLAPNKTRRIKAAESQQEAKRGEKTGNCSSLSPFCLCLGVHYCCNSWYYFRCILFLQLFLFC